MEHRLVRRQRYQGRLLPEELLFIIFSLALLEGSVLFVTWPGRSGVLWTLSPQTGFHNPVVSLCVLSRTVVQFFPPAAFAFSSDASSSILCSLGPSMKTYFQSDSLQIDIATGYINEIYNFKTCIQSFADYTCNTVCQFILSPTIWTLEYLDQF